MTERDHGENRDYPDGSVGRYVREKWGAVPTRPARAARPYVPPVEPPAPRRVPESETDSPDGAPEDADVWAYQPDNAWPRRGGAGPGRPRPEITETDHTQVDPTHTSSHDPFAGVEYGSDTWASASDDETTDERHPNGDGQRPPRPEAADAGSPGPAPRGAAGEPGRTSAHGTPGGPADPSAWSGHGGPADTSGGPADPSAWSGHGGPADSARGSNMGDFPGAAPRGHLGGAVDTVGPPARGGRDTGGAGRGHLSVAGDPTGSMDDPAVGPARAAHLGVADPATGRGPLGVAGDPHADTPVPGERSRARVESTGAGPSVRGVAAEPADGVGPAVRGGRRVAGEPTEPGAARGSHRGADDRSEARRDHAEPGGTGPFARTGHRGEQAGDTVPGAYSGPPSAADDSVTTRTGPAAPHPPSSMPPGARPTPSGPFPADGPHPLAGPATAHARPPRTAPRDTPHWTDPVAVAAQEAQRARSPERTDLSSARLLRNTKRPPQSGWRRMIYVLSGRMFNPGESPTDIRRRQLTARVNQPLLGCYKIAMLSLKGGVGKTTMTATLGATFASLRGDRVVAVDANPDRGTLSQKIPLETSATVRNLLRDAQRVRRYTDVRAYTSQGPSRLEVLASEQDPAVSEAYSEEDYRRTVNLLEHFYNIVLTDCGTGLMHSAMYGVLGVADQLVIVSSGSIDGARSASATMDWLDAHGHGDLVANAVVVINFVHRSRGGVDLDRVSEHFAARCRSVVRIPFDAHLEEGAEIDLDRLEPGTRMALLELAANVADAFERVHSL